MNSPSIWGSVEFNAIARDFSYDEYINWHRLNKCLGAVATMKTYIILRTAFHQQIQEDTEWVPNDRTEDN